MLGGHILLYPIGVPFASLAVNAASNSNPIAAMVEDARRLLVLTL